MLQEPTLADKIGTLNPGDPMSKYKHSGRLSSSRCKRTTRPHLEALESRLVLSSTVLPTVPCPAPFAGAGNESAIVEGLYHNILGRAADSAGLAYWTAQLTAGESAAQVAGQFFRSTEYTTDVVESYYTTYLGRVGDPAGVASWVAKLQAGASEEQVAAAFLSSPEYTAKNVTDGAFVQSLYENVLSRAGDQAGISSWTQILEAGTSRSAVAADFIGSPESSQISVTGDYTDFFDRVGDTAGVSSWVAQIQNGSMTMAEVAASFAGSPEYGFLPGRPTAHLVVTTQPPASVTANAPFDLTVTAENGSGNTITTYTGPVNLVLSGGTDRANLGGTVTVNAVNGVAAFSDLTIDTVGTGYTITASSGTITGATITSININVVGSEPAITGLTPTSGSTAGGTVVTITGTGFTRATAVHFGTVAATGVTVKNDTTITAISPAAFGVVDVTVTTPEGTSSDSVADQFTYNMSPPPCVAILSPATGSNFGGTSVTITGTGFTRATAVHFGLQLADFTVKNDTTITVTSPASTVLGPVDVTVTTPEGTSSDSVADVFTYTTYTTALPVITDVYPATGSNFGGTPVTITGTGLMPVTAVHFGTVAVMNITVVNGTTITVVSPASTVLGTVDITVTTPEGTSAPWPWN